MKLNPNDDISYCADCPKLKKKYDLVSVRDVRIIRSVPESSTRYFEYMGRFFEASLMGDRKLAFGCEYDSEEELIKEAEKEILRKQKEIEFYRTSNSGKKGWLYRIRKIENFGLGISYRHWGVYRWRTPKGRIYFMFCFSKWRYGIVI